MLLLHYCTLALIFASLTTLRHSCNSEAISSLSPAGVEVAGPSPLLTKIWIAAGIGSPLLMAALSFRIIDCGVPGGATKPRHPALLKPGTVSAMVGTLGAPVS